MRSLLAAFFVLTCAKAFSFAPSHMGSRIVRVGSLKAMEAEDDPRLENALPKQGVLRRVGNFIVGAPLEQSPAIRSDVPKYRVSPQDRNWEGAGNPVSDYMKTDLVTLNPLQLLSEAGMILTQNNIAGAPVVDGNGQLVGVLSRKDLLFKIAGRESLKSDAREGARSTRYAQNTRVLQKLDAATGNLNCLRNEVDS